MARNQVEELHQSPIFSSNDVLLGLRDELAAHKAAAVDAVIDD